jgi:pimeloyl-ACP methyl ester carboxylesterase
MLALTYAARHGERVARVALIGCGTFDRESRRVYAERMASRTNSDDARQLNRLRSALSIETNRAGRDELFGKCGKIATRIQAYAPLDAELAQADLRFDERGHRETWHDALRLQDEGIQPAEFANITVRVAMLHGSYDPHPGRMIRDSLSAVVRDLEYHEFPECGHTPWIERHARDPFLAVLTQILERN